MSLCFRERVGALKTQNVTAVCYDLKALCVFNKAGRLFCCTKSNITKFQHLGKLHLHLKVVSLATVMDRVMFLECLTELSLINIVFQKALNEIQFSFLVQTFN